LNINTSMSLKSKPPTQEHRTLWVGEIDPQMNEDDVKGMFS